VRIGRFRQCINGFYNYYRSFGMGIVRAGMQALIFGLALSASTEGRGQQNIAGGADALDWLKKRLVYIEARKIDSTARCDSAELTNAAFPAADHRGTGILFGDQLVLTAFHVLDFPPAGKKYCYFAVREVDRKTLLAGSPLSVPGAGGGDVRIQWGSQDVGRFNIVKPVKDMGACLDIAPGLPKHGETVFLLGYRGDEIDLQDAKPITPPRFYERKVIADCDLTAVCEVDGGGVPEGHSGGPVINKLGQLVGVVTSDLNVIGQTRFEPLAPLRSVIAPHCPTAPATPIAPENVFGLSGSVTGETSGTGKGQLSDRVVKRGKFGESVEIVSNGDERSECNESSGRTKSAARVSASVSALDGEGLKFDYSVHSQGGHYRTAATCLGGQPIGITGHDTMAEGRIEMQGNIDFTTSAERPLKVSWSGVPKDADFFISDPRGQTAYEKGDGVFQGAGSKSFKFLNPGVLYRLSLRLRVNERNEGACCPRNAEGQAIVQIVRE
jgi:Trypsin-like peptidase domain